MPSKSKQSPPQPKPSLSSDASDAADDSAVPGVVEQYQRFLPLAQKLDDADVQHLKTPAALVLLNAQRGVEALMARRAEVVALPGISIDQIESLADLGQALQYANGCIDRLVPITGEVKALLATAFKLRANLLTKADVLVIDGIVPAATVAGIRKGRGASDTAADCIALAALFHDHADELVGHVSVSTADIQAANDTGVKLLAALHPEAGRRAPNKDLAAAIDARDRLWTLFEQTWQHHVWRPGAWLFGRDFEQSVPPLGARTHRRAAKSTPEPVTPPVTSTPMPP